jgi:hypothetical protein
LNIILLIVFTLAGSISSYVIGKRFLRKKSERQLKILNRFIDALNIHYFIISEKNSGLTVYEKLFKGKNIDSSLISGFLQAVHAFGIELTEAEEHTRSLKLDYQNSKVLMSDYKNIRMILIMEKNPSPDFFDSLNALSYDIEEKFGHLLENFDGDITQFIEIRDLLDFHLNTFLIAPLRLSNNPKSITSEEMGIINQAKKKMKEKNSDNFLIRSLYDKMEEIKVADAKIIFKLIQKKIFQPIADRNGFIQKKLASATGD